MARPKVEWITAAELARRLGVKPHAIAAAKRVGRVTPNDEGLYHAAEAMEAFRSSSTHPPGPGRGHKAPPGDKAAGAGSGVKSGSKADWAAKKERESFLKLRLDRLALQGVLVRRDAMEHELASLALLVRDRLRGIGARLRDQLAAESNPRVCGELVDKAIDEILEELSRRADE